MAVIADARLIERRLDTLRGRRRAREAPRGSRDPLPPWAADTLVALGMTHAEIREMEAEAADEDAAAAGEDEADDLDAAIAALENELLQRGEGSVEALHALAEIALARLRRSVATDPGDLFYDAGEVRALALFERVVEGLDRFRAGGLRRTG